MEALNYYSWWNVKGTKICKSDSLATLVDSTLDYYPKLSKPHLSYLALEIARVIALSFRREKLEEIGKVLSDIILIIEKNEVLDKENCFAFSRLPYLSRLYHEKRPFILLEETLKHVKNKINPDVKNIPSRRIPAYLPAFKYMAHQLLALALRDFYNALITQPSLTEQEQHATQEIDAFVEHLERRMEIDIQEATNKPKSSAPWPTSWQKYIPSLG